jgi:hypothetical protein
MNTIMNLQTNRKFIFSSKHYSFLGLYLVIENNLSDNGYFIRCLTSLILNFDSINLSKQIIDFYQKAFDEQDVEV